MEILARARDEKTSGKAYYTFGADDEGIYRNVMVAWEIYGPEEQDQLVRILARLKASVVMDGSAGTVEVCFRLNSRGEVPFARRYR